MKGSLPRRATRRKALVLSVGVVVAAAVPRWVAGQSSAGASVVPKRGVVTITMAIVGDPGNPSVGVIQTFGGPKGDFVDPPENKGSTGIYKSCSDAPGIRRRPA